MPKGIYPHNKGLETLRQRSQRRKSFQRHHPGGMPGSLRNEVSLLLASDEELTKMEARRRWHQKAVKGNVPAVQKLQELLPSPLLRWEHTGKDGRVKRII